MSDHSIARYGSVERPEQSDEACQSQVLQPMKYGNYNPKDSSGDETTEVSLGEVKNGLLAWRTQSCH